MQRYRRLIIWLSLWLVALVPVVAHGWSAGVGLNVLSARSVPAPGEQAPQEEIPGEQLAEVKGIVEARCSRRRVQQLLPVAYQFTSCGWVFPTEASLKGSLWFPASAREPILSDYFAGPVGLRAPPV